MQGSANSLVLVGLLVGVGCSDGGGAAGSAHVASLSLALNGVDLAGNSVQICGSRPEPIDSSQCDSMLNFDGCRCFDFDANGVLIDPATGEPVVINGLCPSTDPIPADWTFDYTLFSGPECAGKPNNDFVCFDVNDLATRENPNQSIEFLLPGLNRNNVVCIAENASKTWNFETCRIVGGSLEPGAPVVFDCGCEPDLVESRTCQCGMDGITAEDLPAGCAFDPSTCDIDCTREDTFACDDTVYVSSRIGSTTVLSRIDPTTLVTTEIATTTEFGYDAIGFNHLDGFIYGISNVQSIGTIPRLVRITRQGEVQDLGEISALAGREWIIGTFDRHANLVIGDFGSRDWVSLNVNVDPPQIVEQHVEGGAPFNPLAWAAQPGTGTIYGYHSFTPELIRFDPDVDETFQFLPFPPGQFAEIGALPCSSAFQQSQPEQLLLYCFTELRPADAPPPPGAIDALFSVNLMSGAVTRLAEAPALAVGDMASCAPSAP